VLVFLSVRCLAVPLGANKKNGGLRTLKRESGLPRADSVPARCCLRAGCAVVTDRRVGQALELGGAPAMFPATVLVLKFSHDPRSTSLRAGSPADATKDL
jgi:hypothetical protein